MAVGVRRAGHELRVGRSWGRRQRPQKVRRLQSTTTILTTPSERSSCRLRYPTTLENLESTDTLTFGCARMGAPPAARSTTTILSAAAGAAAAATAEGEEAAAAASADIDACLRLLRPLLLRQCGGLGRASEGHGSFHETTVPRGGCVQRRC